MQSIQCTLNVRKQSLIKRKAIFRILEERKNGINVTKLKCGHIFCTGCIEEWFSHSTTCPHCRKDFY